MPFALCPPQRADADALYERQRQRCRLVVGLQLTLAPAMLLVGPAGLATNLKTPWAVPAVGALAGVWILARVPGVIRTVLALRRCPSCDGKVQVGATRCEACGQSFGPRPLTAPASAEWSPPAFLARPLPEVEARKRALVRNRIVSGVVAAAGLGATFLVARLGHPVLAFATIPFLLGGILSALLTARCPACDRILPMGKGAPDYSHCPSCTWPLKGPEPVPARPLDPQV